MIELALGFFALSILMVAYLNLASRLQIVDIPNQRSSHTIPVIKGGGIIFYFAILFVEIYHGFKLPYLLIGLTILMAISFVDDLRPQSQVLRSVFHLLASLLILKELSLISALAWWQLLLVIIIFLGILNAYNFMDGINGITGIYSLVITTSLILVQSYVVSFTRPEILYLLFISLMIFGWHNFRSEAKCFAGDVGSITMAGVLLYMITSLIAATNYYAFALFFAVYIVDTGLTVMYRFYSRENIFEAHRSHLYQILVNDKNLGHIQVALLYGSMQLLINTTIIINYNFQLLNQVAITTLIMTPLILGHSFMKYRFLKY